MKIVIIGGTGHIGTYLVPGLVEEGHEVISISRQQRKPYQLHEAWSNVLQLQIDRIKEDREYAFGQHIQSLEPDIVIDLICFTPESAKLLAEALHGNISHFLHCGTTWVHGHSIEVPVRETQSRNPFGEYGINKAAIESYLLNQFNTNGFPATILHPGHIVGPGWIPVNPAGNLNIEIYRKLAAGEEIALPNLGMETLHHVHAADVAQSFIDAINHRDKALGESFHVVSPQAITLRGYAETLADWFGEKANLLFLPWPEWEKSVPAQDARITYDHIAHSPNYSIEKAKKLINYVPKYSSLDAVKESLSWLKANGDF